MGTSQLLLVLNFGRTAVIHVTAVGAKIRLSVTFFHCLPTTAVVSSCIIIPQQLVFLFFLFNQQNETMTPVSRYIPTGSLQLNAQILFGILCPPRAKASKKCSFGGQDDFYGWKSTCCSHEYPAENVKVLFIII